MIQEENNKIETENDVIHFLEQLWQSKKIQDGLYVISHYQDMIVKKYYEYTRYKILFLMADGQYIEAKMIINSELNVPYIPQEFEKFLELQNREVQYELNKDRPAVKKDVLEKIDELEEEKLLVILPHLNDYNLHLYLQQFQNILLGNEISNMTKSLLLALLADQKINHEFLLQKDKKIMKLNPATLIDIRQSNEQKIVYRKLDAMHLQIQSQEIVLQLVNMALLEHYPFPYSEEECTLLLYSAVWLQEEMTNLSITDKNYLYYKLNHAEKLKEFSKKINNLIKSL